MKKSDLTDALLSRIPRAVRTSMRLPITQAEAEAAYIAKSEKELQKMVSNYLRLKGIWFDQDAMHKRRTGTKSAPDFQFPYSGRFVAWELKHGKGKLDEGQERVRDKIIAQGGLWRLITSLEEAKAHLEEIAGLPSSNPP